MEKIPIIIKDSLALLYVHYILNTALASWTELFYLPWQQVQYDQYAIRLTTIPSLPKSMLLCE